MEGIVANEDGTDFDKNSIGTGTGKEGISSNNDGTDFDKEGISTGEEGTAADKEGIVASEAGISTHLLLNAFFFNLLLFFFSLALKSN